MTKAAPINRATVDLSAYPDLVVIYLGMKVRSLKGLSVLARTGREIGQAVAARPDGLLRHENMLFSLAPPHVAMRQYWRDLESLERWTREGLHRGWWVNFLKDPEGTGFWHETYRMKGGIEAIYDDIDQPLGLSAFAPVVPAKGPMFSARARLGAGQAPAAPVEEQTL
jgi:hypothetical protein